MGCFTALVGFFGVVWALILWGLYEIGLIAGEAQAVGIWLIGMFVVVILAAIAAKLW